MGPVDAAQSVVGAAVSTITPEMASALMWMLICILATVHTIKVLFQRTVRRPKHWQIYLLTVLVSVVTALVLWPESSAVPSLIPGLAMGPVANAVFWGVSAPLKRFVPGAWARVNFRSPDTGSHNL